MSDLPRSTTGPGRRWVVLTTGSGFDERTIPDRFEVLFTLRTADTSSDLCYVLASGSLPELGHWEFPLSFESIEQIEDYEQKEFLKKARQL